MLNLLYKRKTLQSSFLESIQVAACLPLMALPAIFTLPIHMQHPLPLPRSIRTQLPHQIEGQFKSTDCVRFYNNTSFDEY